MTRPISSEAVELVKEFEGFEAEAYRDPVGVVTIGYGYTNRAGFGPGVKMGDKWTQKQAEDMLARGLEIFAERIAPMVKVPTNDNEFGAMVSLAYNIGPGAFSRSTMLRRFNAGDKAGAAEALLWFNKAGGRVLRGLIRRREAERALFLSESRGEPRVTPDEPRSTPAKSTTAQAVGVGMLAQAAQVSDQVTAVIAQVTENIGVSPNVALTCVTILALAWIFRERLRKWADGDR